MVRDQIQIVMASPHFAGRSQMAAKLIANPKLSAEDITGLLADMPDASGGMIFEAMMARQGAMGSQPGHIGGQR
jgi:hypothetical protein